MNLPIKILKDKDDNKFIPVTSSNAVIFPDGKNLTDKIKNGQIGLPDNIIVEEDGLYQIKDNAVYPIAHPDISTQPSILPQRFGNLDVYEVLIANGREEEIPIDATVISAFSFNTSVCIPATVRKDYKITNRALDYFDTTYTFPIAMSELYKIKLKANFDIIVDDIISYLTFITDSVKLKIENAGGGSCAIKDNINNTPFALISVSDNVISFSQCINGPTINNFNYSDPRKIEIPLNHWIIYNAEDIIPDYTLIRYFINNNNYYYYNNNTNIQNFYEDLNIQTSEYAVFDDTIFTADNCYGVAINSIPYKVVGIIHDNNTIYYVAISNTNTNFVIYNINLVKVGDFVLGTEGYEAQASVINKGSVFELLNPNPDAVTKFIITSTQSGGNTWLAVNLNSFRCDGVNVGASVGYVTFVRTVGTESYETYKPELIVESYGSSVYIHADSDNTYNDILTMNLNTGMGSTPVSSTTYPVLIEFKAKLGT